MCIRDRLFGKQTLPEGRIIATNGEAGFQGQTLAPGVYFGKWIWQYSIDFQPFTVIPTGKIGLILAKDGAAVSYTHLDVYKRQE